MSPYTKSASVSPRRRHDKESPAVKAYGSGRRYSYSHSRSITPPARRPPSPPPLPNSGRGKSSSSRSSRSSSPKPSRYRHGPQHLQRRKIVESRCIGVFGLHVKTTQSTIREIFSKFGPIERIQVVIDAQTKRSRGFCFIYYKYLEDAKRAKEECCGQEIDSRRIRVDYSITERPHSPTPGVYMGRYTNRYHRAEREHNYRNRDGGNFSRSRQPRTPPSPPPTRGYSHRSSRRSRSRSSTYYDRNRRRHRDEYRSRSHSRSRSYTPRKRSRY